MFRAAARSTPRALRQSTVASSATARRYASTAPADKRYTWKGTAARWGLAVGALYWYQTSPMFADELPSRLSSEPAQFSETDLPTIDAIVEDKRKQLDARLKAKQEQADKERAAQPPQQTPPPPEHSNSAAVATPEDAEKSPEQLEEEAGQQGAFNPETGEINWDCPCLGGMAHGPCGEEFKAAFSCFVYSNEEPKGMDCIDKFQHMQDCFRQYPDIYGAEIADEEAAEAEIAAGGPPPPAGESGDAVGKDVTPVVTPVTSARSDEPAQASAKVPETQDHTTEELKAGPTDAPKGTDPASSSVAGAAGGNGDAKVLEDEVVDEERGLPKKSFDATSANTTTPK